VGPQAGDVDSSSLDKDARLSSRIPGANVAGARGGSWSGHHISSACLAAKLFHVGADVDGSAYHLDQPTVYGW
jgi:hypothetical protein